MISPSISYSNLQQISEQGLNASRKRVEEAATKLSQGELSAQNTVDVISNQRSFEANASVIKAQDEMTGRLLNAQA